MRLPVAKGGLMNVSSRSIWGSSLLFLVSVIVSGCASSATDKANPQASSSSSAAAQRPAKSKASSSSVSQGPALGSSLEAHRQGKAPASGPLKEVYFAFDRYDLSEQARVTLRENAGWLKTNPSARIEIEGHCDERGTTEYNLALGAKRAAAARDYLVSLGVTEGRITSKSFGEELPVCKESTEDCYQKNRRDRFVVVRAAPSS
jgi:peptidoglycan-associated lipoprotein